MKDIAMELSRNELIKRLCEMNESYQLMRKEWFEKTQLGESDDYLYLMKSLRKSLKKLLLISYS